MIGKTNAISGVSAPVPKIKTVSGSIISISDALAMPAVSLVADINAVQSGSGDPSPSNVRPISGWSNVKVWRTGKNLIDDSKTYAANATVVYIGATSSAYTIALPAGTYTISVDFSGETYGMYYREANDSANTTLWNSGAASLTEKTFTIEEDGIFRFWVYRGTASGGVDPTKIIHVQIELGSTPTAYEPYNGNTYTIQLGQTVYGGSLNVTTGVLTVEWVRITNLATRGATAVTINSLSCVAVELADIKSDSNKTNVISSDFKFAGNNASDVVDGGMVNRTGQYYNLAFCSTENFTTVAEFRSYVSDNNVDVVYKLATPQTIQLTPTEVQMLLGKNVLWANSGNSTLQYWARR